MQGIKNVIAAAIQRMSTDRAHVRAVVRASLIWPVLCIVLSIGLWLLTTLNLGDASLSFQARAGRAREVTVLGSLMLAILAILGISISARIASRQYREQTRKAAYRIASDAAAEGFYVLNARYDDAREIREFTVLDCNAPAADLVGTTPARLIGTRISAVDDGALAHTNFAVLKRAMLTGAQEDEFRVSPFGQLQASWIKRRLVRCGDYLAMTLSDITASKAHEQALSRMANADALTKLPNRHWLMGFMPGALRRASATGQRVALLVIDLDNFKNINDSLGHAAGDELLQAVAFRLRSSMRPSNPVVRLGGDEFTVVLEQIESTDEVARVAARLVNTLSEPFPLGSSGARTIEASVGISLYPDDGTEAETLLKHADIAMYAVKQSGKAHHQFYQPHLSELLMHRLSSEEALRLAIERDEFVVYYQPRVNALTGQLCSMEALVRWCHPDRGLVPPLEFISLAEDTGLIVKIGAIVVRKTCTQLAAWRAQGLPMVPVSVNVSSRQFADTDLQVLFGASLAEFDLDPSLIEIELTESCMMGDDESVLQELQALQAMGIKLLVDDFGTGYSSLSQLQRLNFDVLKVDMAFTAALGQSDEGEVFFKAIVWMAHALGMSVVAEGVETAEQLRILQALACDEVQGYLVSRPVTAAQVAPLMQKRYLFPEAPDVGKTRNGGARKRIAKHDKATVKPDRASPSEVT